MVCKALLLVQSDIFWRFWPHSPSISSHFFDVGVAMGKGGAYALVLRVSLIALVCKLFAHALGVVSFRQPQPTPFNPIHFQNTFFGQNEKKANEGCHNNDDIWR